MPRPFASGSRQAPDPYDQYLEQSGFYRKHTARDSSCLFRTISEQMYDTQLHHLVIRQRCVDYMRKHKHLFKKGVDKDIDDYLDEMSKPKTCGTLLELRAVAYLYRRNVILFEAYNTGSLMVHEKGFKDVFRVFFTPEKHFDSVFTSNFIETAAFCQGICYEILYRRVFKLPDVMYAVEQMLHGNSSELMKSKTIYAGPYAKKTIFPDGREFELNTPEETNCILDNRVLCHFHNPNFPQFTETLHHDMHLIEVAQYDSQKITKTLDSLLPDKYVSCVQQLLKDGITPFPYKVAKALDPDIYRNIEFDAWSEMRKEQRFKNWYMGGSNLQVGVKCLVKLGASHNNLYNCHIQDMSPEKGPCLVYIEELAQKHTVPYEWLQPLPTELAKPWPLPFRYQRHIEKNPEKLIINDLKKGRKLNGKSRYRELISTIKKEMYAEDELTQCKDDVSYQLKQFTSIQHYYPPPYEVLAMPFSIDHCNNNNENSHQSRRNSANSIVSHLTSGTDMVKHEPKKDEENDIEYPPTEHFTPYGYEGYSESYYTYPYESSVIHSGSHNPFYCMYSGQQYTTPQGAMVSHGTFVPPAVPFSQPAANHYFPSPGGPLPPPLPPTAILSGVPSSSSNTMTTSNICRHHTGTLSTVPGHVNLTANRSLLSSGADLPNDVATLRFFYNLGYEYYKQMQKSATDLGPSNDKADPVNKLTNDLQTNLKLERENTNGSTAKTDNSNTTQTNVPHGTRRFTSRYFNSKRNDKHVNRLGCNSGGNSQRSFHADGHGKQNVVAVSKTNTALSSQFSSVSTASGANVNNNKVSVSNTINNGSSSEQVQTTPTTTLMTSETWSTDFVTNMPLYSAPAGPVPYNGPCIPVFSESDSHQGVYVQPPTIMTVPYGMYPLPQPPHPGPTFQTYLPPPSAPPMPVAPTPFSNNAFIGPATGAEPTPIVVNPDTMDNGSYAFMGYPPIFYSPTNNGNTLAANGTPMPPGYWYSAAAPPFAASVSPTTAPNSATSTTSVSAPSR